MFANDLLDLRHIMRKPIFVICEQQRLRSACTSMQSDQPLWCSLPRYYNTYTFQIQIFKTLANICSWAGGFESPGATVWVTWCCHLKTGFLMMCLISFFTNRPSSIKGHSHRKSHPIPVKLSEPENSQYQYQNFQSRSRLDARLWLTCRAALVKSLMMEIRGMGEVKGQYFMSFHFLSHDMDKTNKMSVHPVKAQISLGIYPVWSESSLCAHWEAKDQSFLHKDSEDSDQTSWSESSLGAQSFCWFCREVAQDSAEVSWILRFYMFSVLLEILHKWSFYNMKFMKETFGEFHKFHMKWPGV